MLPSTSGGFCLSGCCVLKVRSDPVVCAPMGCPPEAMDRAPMVRFQMPSTHAYRCVPGDRHRPSAYGALRRGGSCARYRCASVRSPACMRIGALYRCASHVRTLCASGCRPHVRTLMRFRKPSRQMTPFFPDRMPAGRMPETELSDNSGRSSCCQSCAQNMHKYPRRTDARRTIAQIVRKMQRSFACQFCGVLVAGFILFCYPFQFFPIQRKL